MSKITKISNLDNLLITFITYSTEVRNKNFILKERLESSKSYMITLKRKPFKVVLFFFV